LLDEPSSGLTTGVWMGRDDAKPVGGLQGGRAPASVFAQFMKMAVANRKVEKFDTELVLPEWQLEPDEDELFGAPEDGIYVDENGMPIETGSGFEYDLEDGEAADSPRLDQDWIDSVLGRGEDPGPRKPDPAPVRKPKPQPPQNPPESLLPEAARQEQQ
jgi:penicillin-binding protein 1A